MQSHGRWLVQLRGLPFQWQRGCGAPTPPRQERTTEKPVPDQHNILGNRVSKGARCAAQRNGPPPLSMLPVGKMQRAQRQSLDWGTRDWCPTTAFGSGRLGSKMPLTKNASNCVWPPRQTVSEPITGGLHKCARQYYSERRLQRIRLQPLAFGTGD